MKNSITNIAKQVIVELQKSEYKNLDMYNCIVSGCINNSFINFDTEHAYISFKGFIAKEISVLNNELYRIIFPICEYK